MRKTVDKLISWTGIIMAAILLTAGGLMTYASNFIDNQVSEQLTQQDITMPAAAALQTQEQKDALLQYAGQKMTTGDQAKAFADHYILVHMNAASNNRTYEEVSGEYLTMSKDANADQAKVQELGQLRQTLFMGNTLRGLLLNAYAFGTMGTVAGIAAVVAYVGAGILFVLGFLGLRHSKNATDAVASAATSEPVPARS
ncbi:hypothetical protein GCM10027053_14310 [Intrasporangium mesophilum]